MIMQWASCKMGILLLVLEEYVDANTVLSEIWMQDCRNTNWIQINFIFLLKIYKHLSNWHTTIKTNYMTIQEKKKTYVIQLTTYKQIHINTSVQQRRQREWLVHQHTLKKFCSSESSTVNYHYRTNVLCSYV